MESLSDNGGGRARRTVLVVSAAAALMGAFLALGASFGVHATRADAATEGAPLVGETSIVNDGPGDQTDPSVSGTLVSYTSDFGSQSEVRYHDLSDGSDEAIASDGAQDLLSDVFGETVVFTRFFPDGHSGIFAFDTSSESAEELDPMEESQRQNSAIGGGAVAWEDYGISGGVNPPSEIVAYDHDARTTTRLTDDALPDTGPSVAPDGSVISWTKCASNGANCDVWHAASGGMGWTAARLTGAEGDERLPDTNGEVVVYQSSRAGSPDIFFQPVGGGAEQRIELPDIQRNPNVSGDLISFESRNLDTGNFDVMVYDLRTDIIHPLTGTPDTNEVLNDISVGEDGKVRVAYVVRSSASDFDVHAFTFDEPDATPPEFAGVPEDIIVEATGPDGAVVSYEEPTATDDVDETVSVECVPASGEVFPLGESTVECSAIGSSGNEASASFTVTVEDTTPPEFTVPDSGVTVEATGPEGAVVDYDASASDLVDGEIAPDCEPASGSTFPIGTTTVECAATDAAGNGASASFEVTVEERSDRIEDLIALVKSYGLHRGLERSLLAKLENAKKHIEASNEEAACGSLDAFVNHVNAQPGKEFTEEQAAELIPFAERIQADLGCEDRSGEGHGGR
ncbi:MAG: HYR domain-containing protein [Actinomycetota bacterium]|jgi:hypothetical protein|nr:HYR domain-containing protein [Actinomycetota bacterium]